MAIEIVAFKPMDKGTLRGFLTVKLTNVGMEIRDCTLHDKEGRRWIGLPSRQYEKVDGTTTWTPIVLFYDRDKEGQFRAATLKALEEFMAAPEPDEDIPF